MLAHSAATVRTPRPKRDNQRPCAHHCAPPPLSGAAAAPTRPLFQRPGSEPLAPFYRKRTGPASMRNVIVANRPVHERIRAGAIEIEVEGERPLPAAAVRRVYR